MTDNEIIYDDEIAPALLEIAKRCGERGMSFVANVEFSPGDTGSTVLLTQSACATSRMTIAPAATIAQRPIVTGATHTARAPIEAPCLQVTPTASQSEPVFRVPSGVTDLG